MASASPSLSSFIISSTKQLASNLLQGIVHGNGINNSNIPTTTLITKINNTRPLLSPTAQVHKDAILTGQVVLFDGAQVGERAVIRGETSMVSIGKNTMIQPRAILSATSPDRYSSITGLRNLLNVGNNVQIGKNSVLNSCIVEDDVKIEDNVVIGEGAVVGKGSVLASGTVIPPGRLVPSGTKWAGNPASFVGIVGGDH
jgi:carbonic anhydrase/acetyltransferase-like protein (isoleucine patch superfamily)